jgi:phosphoadenosine phosphosulfate reductase family protein
MILDSKIKDAQALIEKRLPNSNPVICCSFGKDSMVMLDLLMRMGRKLPVIYWKREHHFPKKNRFANEMIEKYDLEVYDYPPEYTKMIRKGERIEVVNFFSVGKYTIEVPSGIVPYKEGEKYLCGFLDMYMKPVGRFNFPWDTMLIGHKDSDVDPLRGAVPLSVDEYKHDENSPTFVFPIRHFTDEDIWGYTARFGVPQDENRYFGDEEDVDYNNDYYPACTACMNPDNPETVFCPKVETMVPNVSSRIVWTEDIRPAYYRPQ